MNLIIIHTSGIADHSSKVVACQGVQPVSSAALYDFVKTAVIITPEQMAQFNKNAKTPFILIV